MAFTRRKLLVATAGLATLMVGRCGQEPAPPPGNLVAPEPPPPPPPGNLVPPEDPPREDPPRDPDNTPPPPPPGNLVPPPPTE